MTEDIFAELTDRCKYGTENFCITGNRSAGDESVLLNNEFSA